METRASGRNPRRFIITSSHVRETYMEESQQPLDKSVEIFSSEMTMEPLFEIKKLRPSQQSNQNYSLQLTNIGLLSN